MQLPPTNFFASKSTDEEERLVIEDASGQEVEYDLRQQQFSSTTPPAILPATMLGWHYPQSIGNRSLVSRTLRFIRADC